MKAVKTKFKDTEIGQSAHPPKAEMQAENNLKGIGFEI